MSGSASASRSAERVCHPPRSAPMTGVARSLTMPWAAKDANLPRPRNAKSADGARRDALTRGL